jgi:hypothetical protein
MTEPLPVIVETSLQIAWDHLDTTGAISDEQQAAEFRLGNIQRQVLGGERRLLMLSNRAIEAFRHQPTRVISLEFNFYYL